MIYGKKVHERICTEHLTHYKLFKLYWHFMNKLFKNCHKIGLEGVFTKLDIYICNYCQYLGSNELLSAARRVTTLSSAPSLQIQKSKSVNHFSSHSDRDFFCAHTRPEQAGVEDVSSGRGRRHEGGRGRVQRGWRACSCMLFKWIKSSSRYLY